MLSNEIEALSLTLGLANSSFYVDGFLASASSHSELLTLYSEVVPLLKSGGFYLTKFHTNCPELRAKISCEDYARSFVPIQFAQEGDTSHKVLGMHWKSQNDSIVFSIQLEVGDVTCRCILANFSQIFDPFGILQLVFPVEL